MYRRLSIYNGMISNGTFNSYTINAHFDNLILNSFDEDKSNLSSNIRGKKSKHIHRLY